MIAVCRLVASLFHHVCQSHHFSYFGSAWNVMFIARYIVSRKCDVSGTEQILL